jgi:hypothetical protein
LLLATAPKIKHNKGNIAIYSEKKCQDGWGSRHSIWESRPEEEEKKDNFEMQWMDFNYIIKRTIYEIKNTMYIGEAVPIFSTDWVFGHALLFGSKIKKITKDAVWMKPITIANNKFPIIKFNPENPWLNWILESTKKAVKCSKNYYFVQPQYGAGAGDTLGMLLGVDKLLICIKDNPGIIKNMLKTISNVIIALYNKLFQIVGSSKLEGFVNYVGCWSPHKTITIDCDLGTMISEKIYKDIFLPPLLESMYTAKHRIYHLDGTDQLHILDTILNIKDLHAIQWAPGVGREEIMQWIPLIKKIQNKKKSIVLYCTPPEVIPLLQEIFPEGICISTSFSNKEEAEQLIEKIEKIY